MSIGVWKSHFTRNLELLGLLAMLRCFRGGFDVLLPSPSRKLELLRIDVGLRRILPAESSFSLVFISRKVFAGTIPSLYGARVRPAFEQLIFPLFSHDRRR
jgi:hypothetical protein